MILHHKLQAYFGYVKSSVPVLCNKNGFKIYLTCDYVTYIAVSIRHTYKFA